MKISSYLPRTVCFSLSTRTELRAQMLLDAYMYVSGAGCRTIVRIWRAIVRIFGEGCMVLAFLGARIHAALPQELVYTYLTSQ
jgi:hypothetical protein